MLSRATRAGGGGSTSPALLPGGVFPSLSPRRRRESNELPGGTGKGGTATLVSRDAERARQRASILRLADRSVASSTPLRWKYSCRRRRRRKEAEGEGGPLKEESGTAREEKTARRRFEEGSDVTPIRSSVANLELAQRDAPVGVPDLPTEARGELIHQRG